MTKLSFFLGIGLIATVFIIRGDDSGNLLLTIITVVLFFTGILVSIKHFENKDWWDLLKAIKTSERRLDRLKKHKANRAEKYSKLNRAEESSARKGARNHVSGLKNTKKKAIQKEADLAAKVKNIRSGFEIRKKDGAAMIQSGFEAGLHNKN